MLSECSSNSIEHLAFSQSARIGTTVLTENQNAQDDNKRSSTATSKATIEAMIKLLEITAHDLSH